MTQEEKARRYDIALERARNLHKDAIDMDENILAKQCEIIFPELAESEDEKVRKAIKYCIMQGFIGHGCIENMTVDDCLAWLEKQNHVNHDTIETIKRKIIELFDTLLLDKCFSIGGLKNDILKILNDEKIGEQKPTDKIEPKLP